MLEWENDVDLSVWKEDYRKVVKLRKEFVKLGFKFVMKEDSFALEFEDGEIGFQYYYRDKSQAICPKRLVTRCKFDNIVYFGLLARANEYGLKRTCRFLRWVLLTFGRCYTITQFVPIDFFLQLQEIDLFGIKVNVPLDIEGFFAHTLGDDWKTPKKEFKRPRKYFVIGGIRNEKDYPKWYIL